MTELVACLACRRHVHANAARCPFCDRAQLDLPRSLQYGRLSRAAVFAAATLSPACWTDKATPATTPQQPPLRERLDRQPAGTIIGVVREFDTNKPLTGYTISVMLRDGTTKETQTNARGEYKLEGLPPGDYEVQYFNAKFPRFGRRVTLEARVGATADLPVYKIPEQPAATPYGAPPARRRIV